MADVNKNAKSVDINKQDVNSMADGLDEIQNLRIALASLVPDTGTNRYDHVSRLNRLIQLELDRTVAERVLAIIGPDEDPERIHISHFVHEASCIPQLSLWARDNLRAELRAAVQTQGEK